MTRLGKYILPGACGGALLWLFEHVFLLDPAGPGPLVSTFLSRLIIPPRILHSHEALVLMISLGVLAGLMVFLLMAARAKVWPSGGGILLPRTSGTDSSGSPVVVRQATAHDAQAIARLAHQLGYPTSSSQASSRLRAIAALPDHIVLVVLLDGEVAGWIHVYMAQWLESDAFAEIGGLVVEHACRGRGVGARLVLAAQEWASDQGLSLMRVRSRSDRSAAHAFYTTQGFVRVKEQVVFDKILNVI